jgi:[acyl-carrier-protein] S-malonyltransferase
MKIGMLFPGYGNQFIGMGKELYDHSRSIQEYFEEASNCLNINFVKLCFASSDIEISKLMYAYPALFLISVATANLVSQTGCSIDYVAGHGIGEYSALCFAGGLNFPDGLYLLSKLSHFYTQVREQPESFDFKSVLIDGISARKIKQICAETQADQDCPHIAVYETKTEHVVTGSTMAINALVEGAYDAGADTITALQREEGLHTPLMAQLVDQLKNYLTKVDFKDLKIPLIASVDAKEVCYAKKAQAAIMRQIIEPLYWKNVLKQFGDADLLIVPAPAKALVLELQSYYPDKIILGINTVHDLEMLKKYVS